MISTLQPLEESYLQRIASAILSKLLIRTDSSQALRRHPQGIAPEEKLALRNIIGSSRSKRVLLFSQSHIGPFQNSVVCVANIACLSFAISKRLSIPIKVKSPLIAGDTPQKTNLPP